MADPSGVEIRELFRLRSQKDQTAAEQLALGLSKDSRKDLKAIKTRSKLDRALQDIIDIPGLRPALNGGLKRTSLEGNDDVSRNPTILYLNYTQQLQGTNLVRIG